MKSSEIKENRISILLPQAFGVSAASIGLVALLGWILNLPLLASFGAGLIPMSPSTGLLLVLLGVAIFFRNRFPQSREAYWTGIVIGSMGSGSTLLLFYFSSADIYPQFELFGFPKVGTFGGVPIGHMSLLTAICFVFVSLAFLATLSSSVERPRRATVARSVS
jgi:hypothetical protein